MATMIPSMPLDVEIRSDEDKIFYKNIVTIGTV